MNIHQRKKVLFVALIILFFATSILYSFFQKEIVLLIIIPMLCIWFVLYNKWWRCPHCNKSLGRLEYKVTHCKYCGNKLSNS